MKNVSRIVAVATLSALAVAAPATANAKPTNKPVNQPSSQGVSKVEDVKGDVLSYTGAAAPEHLAAAADVEQVRIKVKKDVVEVTVRGAFAAPDSGVGTFMAAGFQVNGRHATAVTLRTPTGPDHPDEYASDCSAATGVADFARDRAVFTVPRVCLGGAAEASVFVLTEAWDLSDESSAVYDILDSQPVVHLGAVDEPAKPGKGNGR